MTTRSSDSPSCPRAAIDIGTNTLRLLIGRIEGGKLIRLKSERSVTRLGRNLTETGVLDKDSIENSIRSLVEFKALIDQFKCDITVAVGTSALRDAANALDFVTAVKSSADIDVIVISGVKEAQLTVTGVLGYNRVPAFPALIVDVGGGSTEWILCSQGNEKPILQDSVQIGAVRLLERFIHNDPPTMEEINIIRSHVFESVTKSFRDRGIGFGTQLKTFVATGGTATTIAAIDLRLENYDAEKVHWHQLSIAAIKRQLGHLSSLPLSDRTHVLGLEPGRADIIIPGIIILSTVMEALETVTLTVSDYGLLEGILLDAEGKVCYNSPYEAGL